MDHTHEVDQDAVLRARTMLLGSGRPSVGRQVEAYRVLSQVNPLVYLPKLTKALLSSAYAPELRGLPEARLARYAEAAATARRLDVDDPHTAELLVRTLSAYQRELYNHGRRAEGFAVCEEMAAAGRRAFARGHVPSPVYGHGPLAVALAEDGRHREAAEIRGQFVEAARADSTENASFWDVVALVAELDAAGRHEAALDVLGDAVAAERAEVEEGTSSLAILTWQLVHRAGILDSAGRHVDARRTRQEALTWLSELDMTGERKSWSNILSWWVTLYALSGRSAEPAPRPGSPGPAFGMPLFDWSPAVRHTYFEARPVLEEQAAALRERAGAEPREHLPALLTLHRRITIRAALHHENRSHRILKPLRPLFDEGVSLARRLTDATTAQEGRAALAQALTDRSMFLIAAKQYGEAYDDYREVVDLPA
ncbi:hypothetical protein ACIQAC_12225 [Streptomyces sp. NPDC088387]|uniref:hypothetical protein n=1 Tax=Streptomyces sp. NPDC088387 TaxID=3365859 RepID=UPI003810D35D